MVLSVDYACVACMARGLRRFSLAVLDLDDETVSMADKSSEKSFRTPCILRACTPTAVVSVFDERYTSKTPSFHVHAHTSGHSNLTVSIPCVSASAGVG